MGISASPEMTPRTDEIDGVLAWLKNMSTQLGKNMVPKPKRKDPEALKEQNRWMDAPELLARVEAVRTKALQKVKEAEDGIISKLEAAGYVHDALLATTCFGYMPPMRDNSVLLTLNMPSHKTGCQHEDCQHKANGCLGNRVYEDPTTGERGGVLLRGQAGSFASKHNIGDSKGSLHASKHTTPLPKGGPLLPSGALRPF